MRGTKCTNLCKRFEVITFYQLLLPVVDEMLVLVDSLVAGEALDETTKTNEQHDCLILKHCNENKMCKL